MKTTVLSMLELDIEAGHRQNNCRVSESETFNTYSLIVEHLLAQVLSNQRLWYFPFPTTLSNIPTLSQPSQPTTSTPPPKLPLIFVRHTFSPHRYSPRSFFTTLLIHHPPYSPPSLFTTLLIHHPPSPPSLPISSTSTTS